MKEKVLHYWKNLGPGLVSGAADDDPSGIATYSQTGAQYGFKFLWLSFFSLPFMVVVQEMCARIGLVTGKGLTTNIKENYSKKVLYFCGLLLLFANTFNIGADLGAMAQGVQLIFPSFDFTILIIFFAVFSLCFQIFVPYKTYAKFLKYLTFALFSYIFSSLLIHINWHEALKHTFIPSFSLTKDSIILICAILGTTISPYLFFWQTSQEVEEHIAPNGLVSHDKNKKIKKHIGKMRIDVFSGMFFSNLVMFFIIIACAGTLFANGITDITSAADAAQALRPFAGNLSYFLFAVGIIGTGLLAIPVLAGSASYVIAETFDFKEGLFRKWYEAKVFYGVMIFAVGFGILFNFIGLDPIKALFYSALLNGLTAPVVLYLIVQLSSNEKVMGQFKSRKISKIIGWATFAIMTIVALLAVFYLWM
ncbi:MAG: Nramp family divalent metal transporter [Patescibacteria group bacterium]